MPPNRASSVEFSVQGSEPTRSRRIWHLRFPPRKTIGGNTIGLTTNGKAHATKRFTESRKWKNTGGLRPLPLKQTTFAMEPSCRESPKNGISLRRDAFLKFRSRCDSIWSNMCGFWLLEAVFRSQTSQLRRTNTDGSEGDGISSLFLQFGHKCNLQSIQRINCLTFWNQILRAS